MKVIRGLIDLPVFRNPVLTIGTFDGVHKGHRTIIKRLVQKAKDVNGESIIITFEPHPRLVIERSASKISLITLLSEKINILAKLSLDYLVVIPFTREFSDMSAHSYIKDFIVNNFHPHTFIIGYDHHFGKNRLGNFEMLVNFQKQYNYELEEISVEEIDDVAVSSTKIREALLLGNIEVANEYLSNNYSICGQVVHGKKHGREIGFPTANIKVNETHKLILAKGVYAVLVHHNQHKYKGMMNIGTRPTLSDELKISIEAHIFDFSNDIYDHEIEVEFVAKIRDEKKFNSIEELKTQLEFDKHYAISILE